MIIILHGPDTFRSRIKLREIETAYREKHPDAVFIEWLDGSTISFHDLSRASKGGSLFDTTRLVVVENFALNQELIEGIIKHKLAKDKETVLVLFEEISLRKEKAHKQLLQQADKCEEFNVLKHAEATRWFLKYTEQKGTVFDFDVIKNVVELCRADMWLTANELDKLWVYKKGGKILEKDLSTLGVGILEAQLFPTIDAVFKGDTDEAIFHMQVHWRYGEHPQIIFSMLERQLKLIALIKDETQNQSKNLVQALKLHPFVIKKTQALSNRFSWQKIRDLYERVASLDEKVKSGKMDPVLATELLAMAISK